MTYDRPSLYLTWGGTLGTSSGPEVWQTGVRIAAPLAEPRPTMPSSGQLGDLFDDVLSVFHATPGMWISTSAFLNWAKVAPLNTEGEYTAEAVTHDGGPVAGGSTVTTERSGMQDSTVVSLWSGLTFGKANHGRFYTPWSNSQIDGSSGRVPGGVVTTMLAAAKLLIDDINSWGDALADPGRVIIMSKVGAGTSKYPSFVGIGDVRDTQRRRRNAVQESYDYDVVA